MNLLGFGCVFLNRHLYIYRANFINNMLKTLSVFSLSLFINISVFSQDEKINILDHKSILNKIEHFTLLKQFDSITYYSSKIERTTYINQLYRIAKGEKLAYQEYYDFIKIVSSKINLDYLLVSNFINDQINEPSNKDDINLNYVKIKWLQTSKLRDEVTIEAASKEQDKLEKYIANFNKNDIDVRKALLYASTHQLVLYAIEKDLENGKKLSLENLIEAKSLIDKELTIAALYHLCDFLILEGKLDEYINTCEEGLAIEAILQEKSPYYVGTIIHALDAYIYKGGHDKRIQELLKLINNNENTRPLIYSLYAKYLGNLNVDEEPAISIFKEFEVTSLIAFSEKVEALGSQVLNPNDLYHLLNEISVTLQKHNYLEEALNYKTKSVNLTRKIYSDDLANSLASVKIQQAIKEKDLEIKHQNERNKLYFIIVLLIATLFLITVVAFLRSRKQSKVLEHKNSQVQKTLKEKEILIKEVHHRVKNNFQIVSSLLEMQSQGIEDKKAIEMANQGLNRIKSMALIHQKLYQNEDGLIDFKEYIQILVNELSSVYVFNKNIETNIEMDNLFFNVDTAIPLGLIVNELVTNAFKHAFEVKTKGKLNIKITKEFNESYKLTVSDNGNGVLKEININEIKSLGLRLVSRLAKQLHGKLTFKNTKNEVVVEVSFKDYQARKRIL